MSFTYRLFELVWPTVGLCTRVAVSEPTRAKSRILNFGKVDHQSFVFEMLRDADVSVGKALVNLIDEVLELSFGYEEAWLGAVDVAVDVIEIPVAILNLAVVKDGGGKRLKPLLADELVRELADGRKRSESEVARSRLSAA